MEIVVFFCFSENFGSEQFGLFEVFKGPGGFRKLLEACRIHFHLFWYLSDFMVPSYDQKIQQLNNKKSNGCFNVSVEFEHTDKDAQSGPRVPGDLKFLVFNFGFPLLFWSFLCFSLVPELLRLLILPSKSLDFPT